MSNGVKWLISSSGRYMFVKYRIDTYGSIYGSYTGFNAKIYYGKEKDTPNYKIFLQSISLIIY